MYFPLPVGFQPQFQPDVGALAAFRTRRFGETTLTFYRAAPGPG
jgi:hypothetical protein